jgi:hypothetical protein
MLLEASLYLLVIAGLFGSAIYVFSLNPLSRLNRAYAALAFAQLAWVLTLFIFTTYQSGAPLLFLGRANFAAAALVPPAVLFFVRALLNRPLRYQWWLAGETLVVAILSLFTGLVDRSEAVQNGVHVTVYGLLFLLYIVHLLAYLGPALWQALRPKLRLPTAVREQTRLIGIGMLVTTAIGLTTNVVLPYGFQDFRWINLGTLATMMALAGIAYSACFHHLFNVRVVIRRTVILALLIAFTLELYQAGVSALTKLLPFGDPTQRNFAAAAVALIINAFTQQPLRWWLERIADRLGGKSRQTYKTGKN